MTTSPQPAADAALFRGAVRPTLVVGVVVLAGATILAGGRGALGAVIGIALVVAFFGVGLLILRHTARTNPRAVMAVALMSYVVKVTLLALMLVLLGRTELFDRGAFAAATLACALAWLAGEVLTFWRLALPSTTVPSDSASPVSRP